MEVKFHGMVVSQSARKPRQGYPQDYSVKCLDTQTGAVLDVVSPVMVDPTHLQKMGEFVLIGYSARLVQFERNGREQSFVSHQCQGITGKIA